MKHTILQSIITLLILMHYFGLMEVRIHQYIVETKPVQIHQYIVETKPDSFFYIHCPKTGTSLFTVLRNSLDSCLYENFSCFGVLGGGFLGSQLKSGKDVFPYDAKVMFPNISTNEVHNINICNGSLPNCSPGQHYHCPYSRCGYNKNKVTMSRNPYKWLPSYVNWMWPQLASKGESIETMLPFQSQIHFTTGTTNVTKAINILQTDYVWWGISDYWEISVCTFHCKFGGTISDSELGNTRDLSKGEVLTLDDVKKKVPLAEDIIPNFTEYVDYHYSTDVLLYSELLSLFWIQADLCECRK